MTSASDTLTPCFAAGLKKGLDGYVWLLKILVPVSLFTFLLAASGLMTRMDFLLQPAMGLLSLPPEAAVPLLVGLLTGIYGGIAAMSVLPLNPAHMTVIAVFLLISHSLIQEGIIQGKSGIRAWKATLWRLGASVAAVLTMIPFLDMAAASGVEPILSASASRPFAALFIQWAGDTVWLCFKMFVIIMPLMVIMEAMKRYRLADRMIRTIAPLLRLMGLSRSVAMLWLTAVIFGVSYGAAVIIEETRDGGIDPDELERLHVSIGINHAMIEDPVLFLSLGLSAFWLWVPRLAAAVIAVHLFNLARRLRNRYRRASLGEKGADVSA